MSTRQEIEIPADNHALIARIYFGTLSTVRAKDGLLSSNPVGFDWDGSHIRISTLKSRLKYKNILADDRVAFCILSNKDVMDYIEIRGFATLQDDADRQFMRRQFMRAGGNEPPEDLDSPGAERVIITLHPLQVSSPVIYGGRFKRGD